MKKELRKNILDQRNNLASFEVLDKSVLITENLIEEDLFEENMNVLVYMDFRNEVMTEFLRAYLETIHANIILPKTFFKEKKMTLHLIENIESLVISKYGILEPTTENEIDAEAIDIVIIPGVAFDKAGYRLGYGGGFYDRLLPKLKKQPKIAIAFDLQLVEEVPREVHDSQVDMIITETQVIKINPIN